MKALFFICLFSIVGCDNSYFLERQELRKKVESEVRSRICNTHEGFAYNTT